MTYDNDTCPVSWHLWALVFMRVLVCACSAPTSGIRSPLRLEVQGPPLLFIDVYNYTYKPILHTGSI